MNQNEISNNELNKTEQFDQSNNGENSIHSDDAISTSTTEVILTESLTTTTRSGDCPENVSATNTLLSENLSECLPSEIPNEALKPARCILITEMKETDLEEPVSKLTVVESVRQESKVVEDLTEAVATTTQAVPSYLLEENSCVTATKTEATTATLSKDDLLHLHHAASAPLLGSDGVLSRGNIQQQRKIKSFHDAKQTALWDTKSSTSSGGTILKSGGCNAVVSPRLVRKISVECLPRRVSFPKSDDKLVTGYLEPADPWKHVSTVNSSNEIADLYIESCHKHQTKPLPDILEHVKGIELNKTTRQPMLSLKETLLMQGDCEALEEILKRVQYKSIDLSSCELEESAISTICEIIEFYEAANELNISSNSKGMTNRGWNACSYMVGRSQALQVLNAEGNSISKLSAEGLGNALVTSNLHTLKLEHCGLRGLPLSSLCSKLRNNKVLKELWLAHNDLNCRDAESIAELLKNNHYLELVDISNNDIGDDGLKFIVEALIAQSRELQRRSIFQRTKAIEVDIFSSVEVPTDDEQNAFEKDSDNSNLNGDFNCKDCEEITTEATKCTNNNNNNANVCEDSQKNSTSEPLIPDLDDCSIELAAIEATALVTDENEPEEDTEDTIKSNHAKIKQQSTGASCGQSMLDKLLSMNSDSSSEEGASNLSTDTIAACGSDDTSFVSDDIFEVTAKSNTAISNSHSQKNQTAIASIEPTTIMTTTQPIILTSSQRTETSKETEKTEQKKCGEQIISCDNQTLEATRNDEIQMHHDLSDMSFNSCPNNNDNNENNKNNNNNNNNTNIVQNQQSDLRELIHNSETRNETMAPMPTNKVSQQSTPSVFEVMPEECDFHVPCPASGSKQTTLLLQNPTNGVDVNKNTRLGEDYDDAHSTDSAFESASEGDISRHLPEEFTRISTSLDSAHHHLDDITKEIETATIATESTECLVEAGTTPKSELTPLLTPLTKIGKQKSDEVKTKEITSEVRFAEPLPQISNEASQTASTLTTSEHECSLPKVTIETSSVICPNRIEEHNSPIPTPPPPSTSPGGASLSMRRTDSSCSFITTATRNHSHSSDSLCSDNSLDGSVSSDLNSSTSTQLNEKLTKNDTLTRQLRQCDSTADGGNRMPSGLKALAVWNNKLTKESGHFISDLLMETVSLELLNIGKNCLSNDFIYRIKDSLAKNNTLTTLGLQSAHLSESGIITLSSILTFGGNSTLQRIDIRDNKLEVESLTKLAEALKSNTTVTQIDIDDEPKRLSIGSDAHLDYARGVENVRSMCSRNEKTQAQLLAEKSANASGANKRRSGYYVGSRKISLTCHSRPLIESSVASAVSMPQPAQKLEVKRKTGVRLRSPVPSPPTYSPSSSPNRNRFQVCRVNEVSPLTSPLAQTPPPSAVTALSRSADSQQSGPAAASSSSVLSSLTTSASLPSMAMATATSSTQTIKRPAVSPSSRFHVSKIYEDTRVPLAKRSLPPITPPITLPPTPMLKSAPKNNSLHSDDDDDDVSAKDEEIRTNSHLSPETSLNDKNETINSIQSSPAAQIEHQISPAQCPIAVFNENDITLTRDSANKILSDAANAASTTILSKEVTDTAESAAAGAANPLSAQPVAKKVSWIANQTGVDKLLTLFQQSAIFQRGSSPEPKNIPTAAENTTSVGQPIPVTNPAQTSVTPMLKQSPPTCSKFSSDMLGTSSNEPEKAVMINLEHPKSFLSRQIFEITKQVFRQNVSASNESVASASQAEIVSSASRTSDKISTANKVVNISESTNNTVSTTEAKNENDEISTFQGSGADDSSYPDMCKDSVASNQETELGLSKD